MLSKLASKFQSKEQKRLLSNFFSLSLLQMMNYILPLVITPYLFITLGSEKFGLISFAQVIVTYFGLFVNYGFNLSATKEISINKDNIKKISEIYATVTIIKVIFSLIAFSIFSLMIFNIDKFSEDWKMYLLTFGMIVESLLFPIWFFQGMERMKYITIIYTFSKLIVTILIFLIIKNPNDYLMVPILYFIGSISSGLLSTYVLFKIFQISFIIPTFNQILFQIQDGWHLFVSNATINMYRNANILILGLVTTTLYVGYYALVEKVIKSLQALMAPISEALYPYLAQKNANQCLEKSIKDIIKISKYYFSVLIVLTFLTFILSPFIVHIISGSHIDNPILDMKIMSLIIVFGGLNYLFGVIGLVSLGYKKYFMLATLVAGSLNVMLCFLLTPILYDIGAAISLTISELILLLILLKKILSLSIYKDKIV